MIDMNVLTRLHLVCAFRDKLKQETTWRQAWSARWRNNMSCCCWAVLSHSCRSWEGLLGRMISCTFLSVPDVPAGRKLTPFIYVLRLPVINEACELVTTGPLLFMCPFNLNAWPPTAVRDVDKQNCDAWRKVWMRIYLTFVSGVVPFQHGSVSSHTSISHELHTKANTAGGAKAVWFSDLLEQCLWTQSRAWAYNICWAATPHLFTVQPLLLQQVYGHTIYGQPCISNVAFSWCRSTFGASCMAVCFTFFNC